jgi:hypothetical protein
MRSRGTRESACTAGASALVLGLALGLAVGCDNGSSGGFGPAAQLSEGAAFGCAVRDDATVACWGRNDSGQASPPPDATFQQVASGVTHACGLLLDGNLQCWGTIAAGESSPPTFVDADGSSATTDDLVPIRYAQVIAGLDYGCGIAIADDPTIAPALNDAVDQTAVCWGLRVARTRLPQSNNEGQATPPAGVKFKQLTGRYTITCGIRVADDNIECWGSNESAPVGEYVQVSTGFEFSCAIDVVGDVTCWGSEEYRKVLEAPAAGSGPYTQVSAGSNHACALKSDGSVVCWGSNCDVTVTGPDACSVTGNAGVIYPTPAADPRPDTRLPFLDGRTVPPAGPFTQISAGANNTCAIRPDGQIACWGDNASGQSSPPAF